MQADASVPALCNGTCRYRMQVDGFLVVSDPGVFAVILEGGWAQWAPCHRPAAGATAQNLRSTARIGTSDSERGNAAGTNLQLPVPPAADQGGFQGGTIPPG